VLDFFTTAILRNILSFNPKKLFFIVCVFFYSNAFLPLLNPAQTDLDLADAAIGSNNVLSIILAIFLFCFSVGINIVKHKSLIIFFKKEKVLFIFLTLIFISSFRSYDIMQSLRKFTGIYSMTIIAFYFGDYLTVKELFKLFRISFFSMALASILFATFMPSLGVMSSVLSGGVYEGAWKGIFAHKNNLGQTMTFGMIFFIGDAAFKVGINKFLQILFILICLLNSHSTTAIIVFGIVFFIYIYFNSNTLVKNLLIGAFSLILMNIIIIGGTIDLANYFTLIGKDIT
jgi:exopolysaccharide production protein ExoQ